jgi:26S proteasome non-ATPase regulatory subunit 9
VYIDVVVIDKARSESVMSSSSSTSPAKQVRALSAKKDSIQLQLSAQLSILKANNATLHTPPLVDAQGFPRDDIDVWAVRHARVRVIELRNDLDKAMQEIGTALEAVYDPNAGSGAGLTTDGGSDDAGTLKKSPFAKVGGVSPGSPAAEAVRSRPL